MELIDIVFRERLGYRPQHLRPFGADATGELIRQLDEDTEGGTNITPAALSRTAGRIIRPVAQVGTDALIPNGWSEKRFMFIMKVLVRETRGARSTLEITGMTDYVGAVNSLRGVKLDPDMRLYFNNITEVNQMFEERPTGRGWHISVAGSHHIISPQTMPDFSRERMSPGTMTMRPEDVFRSSPKDILQTSFGRRVERDSDYSDMRYSFTGNKVRLSNRWNDSSTRYLNKSLRALKTANDGEEYGSGLSIERDPSMIMKDARKQVMERTTNQIPLFHELNADTNIMEQGFISFSELQTMNPNFNWEDVKVIFEDPSRSRNYAHDTSDWNGKDHTTIAATQIARALPTYMAFHQIAYIDFEADNMSFGGEIVILIPEVLPMLGKAINQGALQSFEQRLLTELFIDMLPWDDCPFELRVRADLSGDILINIKIANENPGEFAFPVFCDSLVAPVVVDDIDCINDMGSTLTGIVDRFGSNDRPLEIITETATRF